jgi:hypothetical protein
MPLPLGCKRIANGDTRESKQLIDVVSGKA